ncbi:Rhodanese-like protein [Trametes punicea]|nr:Rhodanese-like protein [Trametes punicea]
MFARSFLRHGQSAFRRFGLRTYASMFGDHCPLVLTPAQLQNLRATATDVDLAVVDVSWHMPNSPRKAAEEYLRVHLPEARFMDLDEVAAPHPLSLSHMMPDPTTFAKSCSRRGIGPKTHVVLYDTHGVFSSPRALYMFRTFGHHRSSILDGGLPGWQAHSGDTESGEGPKALPKLRYDVPALNADAVKGYDEIVANAELDPAKEPNAFYVLDARSRGRFLGKDPEPRPGLSSGHMPYAISLPFTAFLETHTVPEHLASKVVRPSDQEGPYTYTRLRSTQAMFAALEEALGPERTQEILQGKRQVVTSCGSGMTAGVLWLGLKLLGVERVGLYDESWTGYAMRPESKIVKEE